MSNDSQELFNIHAFSCLTRLEMNEEFDSLDFNAGEAVKSHQFITWEKKNTPIKLPEDLKSFYLMFNGIKIIWKVLIGENPIDIGSMTLNRLEDFKRIPVEGIFLSSEWLDYSIQIINPSTTAAFIIDSYCEVGDIVLVYTAEVNTEKKPFMKGGVNNPTVWLIDLSCRWHFIASNFSDYLRLMYAHLGIIGWQEAFVPEGLTTVTRQWMNIFCKERLLVDIFNRNTLIHKRVQSAAKSQSNASSKT